MPIESTRPDQFPAELRGDIDEECIGIEEFFADTNILQALLRGEVSFIPPGKLEK